MKVTTVNIPLAKLQKVIALLKKNEIPPTMIDGEPYYLYDKNGRVIDTRPATK